MRPTRISGRSPLPTCGDAQGSYRPCRTCPQSVPQIRTRALVLGGEGCSLTTAFLKVSEPLQKHLRSECPFRVLLIASAYNFHRTVTEEDDYDQEACMVGYFFRNCKEWKASKNTFETAVQQRYGDDRCYWPKFDLVQGRFSLIMFECLRGVSLSPETPGNFVSNFISSLKQVPAVAVQTYGSDKMGVVPMMAEHVSRSCSLLLLDSRDRDIDDICKNAKSANQVLRDAKQALDEFARNLHLEDSPEIKGEKEAADKKAWVCVGCQLWGGPRRVCQGSPTRALSSSGDCRRIWLGFTFRRPKFGRGSMPCMSFATIEPRFCFLGRLGPVLLAHLRFRLSSDHSFGRSLRRTSGPILQETPQSKRASAAMASKQDNRISMSCIGFLNSEFHGFAI